MRDFGVEVRVTELPSGSRDRTWGGLIVCVSGLEDTLLRDHWESSKKESVWMYLDVTQNGWEGS